MNEYTAQDMIADHILIGKLKEYAKRMGLYGGNWIVNTWDDTNYQELIDATRDKMREGSFMAPQEADVTARCMDELQSTWKMLNRSKTQTDNRRKTDA